MNGKFYLLDTFSNELFKGNPTPVCVLEYKLSEKTMHSLAKEFNAPVTVFVEPINNSKNYPIRYFTMTGEIPACGHATLGAAFLLLKQNNQIIFETIEKIKLQARSEKDLTYIQYPKFNPVTFDIPTTLFNVLGIKNHETHFFCKELESLFIEVKEENQVKKLNPNFQQLLNSSNKIKEVVVMSKAFNKNYDFVLRSFCPWIGINEDPVTGSVHSVLGHYWSKKLNKSELIAYQNSERGGLLFVKPSENNVEIGGHNKIIVEGSLI